VLGKEVQGPHQEDQNRLLRSLKEGVGVEDMAKPETENVGGGV
jgi:hypothetical protein